MTKHIYTHDDGSQYSINLTIPNGTERDKYSVDLLRHSVDEHERQREQRHTLAQYNSYGEAEEHFYEAEKQLYKSGLKDFDIEDMSTLPYSATPTLMSVIYPPEAEGDDIAAMHLLNIDKQDIQQSYLQDGTCDELQVAIQELDRIQSAEGDDRLLQEANRLAHANATAITQPKVFSLSGGTNAEIQNTLQPASIAETDHPLDGIDWFESTFEENESLLQPLDATVNYALVLQPAEADGLELVMQKVWREDNGSIGKAFQTIQGYESDEMDTQAASDRDALLDVYDQRGLQGLMNQVELQATRNGYLDAHRNDLRLFTDGPPDRFETLAQRLEHEINPYWNTEGQEIEDVETEQPKIANLEKCYHRLDVREIQSETELRLGYSIIASAYPQLPIDFDDEEIDDTTYPSYAWALHIAHFEDEADAQHFVTEKRDMPLADIAHDAVDEKWQSWTIQDISRFMSGAPQLIDHKQWQPHEQQEATHTPYWRLDSLPVNDPDGNALGHSLHIVVYPDIPNGQHLDISEDTSFQIMEVAHFEK